MLQNKIILLLITVCGSFCVYCQHIYDNPCSYNISTQTFIFNRNTIKISGKTSFEVYLNFCGPVNVKGCDPAAFACVLSRNGKQKTIRNAGRNFDLIEYDDEIVFKSKGSAICGTGRYEVYIHLDLVKVTSTITRIEDCELHIRILNPNTNITSVTRENGYMINMQPLKNISEIIIPKNNTKIALSFWKPSTSCISQTISGCEIFNGQTNSISHLQRQHIVYSYETNIISIRSNNAQRKPNKIVSDIIVKCNWDVELANPKKLLAKYKFQIESKYGCVKLPMNCLKIVDDHHFTYNISKLNRPEGWNVATPNGSASQILLNVCGPLKMVSKNLCTAMFSQICEKGTVYLNHGSTYTPIQEYNDALHLHLKDGSICPQNSTKTITTNIQFMCSFSEKGPVLKSMVNCSNEITWETPEACPNLPSDAYNLETYTAIQYMSCSIVKNGRKYDLSKLSLKSEHYTVKIGNYVYSINVCAPLKLNSQTVLCKVSGACLYDATEPNIKKNYFSFGWPTNPIIENNNVLLKYIGGICKLAIKREMIIHLYCSNEEKGLQFLNRSDCVHEFSWYTKHACPMTVQTQRSASYKINWLHSTLFTVNFTDNLYVFNLTHGNYIFKPNSSNIEIQRNSEFNLQVNNCKYYLEYEMKNEICETSFKNLKIILECNQEQYEPIYEMLETANCSVTLKLTSSDVCNFQNECYENMNHNNTASTKSNESIGDIVRSTDIISSKNAETIFKAVQTKKTNLECNTDLNLRDITNVKISTQNNTLYSIGYETGCGDLICKNNISIGSLNEHCPSVNIDHLNSKIQLTILGDECGQNLFTTKIIYTCFIPDMNIPEIVEEKPCSVNMTIPNSNFCNVFNLEYNSPSTVNIGAIIFGISILIVAIVILLWIILRSYKSGYSYGCSGKTRTFIYTRNTQL